MDASCNTPIMTKRIAVIGAGIAGITTAYYLAKLGYAVTVYEQDGHAAARTSFANGGQISVSNSETWTTWSNVKKGIKWMFNKDAPLLIRPSLDPAQWRWIARFMWHTIRGDHTQDTISTIKMGLAARALYTQICQEEQIQFDHSQCGILHFYKDQEYLAAATRAQALYNQAGCEWDMLDSDQTIGMDPALHSIQHVVGGAWTQGDSTGDIHKFCVHMAQVLKHKYHVEFVYNHKIDSVDQLNHFDATVIANGIGSVALARTAGDHLPIYPVKGYSITINNVDPKHLPRVSLLDDQAKIVTASLGNRLRVAGTAELAGENYDIRQDRIDPLLNWVHVNLPNIDTRDHTTWACLRPMTPNMMPVVAQSRNHSKVFYNVGHGHLGWTLGPATAHEIADIVKSKIGYI